MEDPNVEYYRKIVCVDKKEALAVMLKLPTKAIILGAALIFKSNLSVFTNALSKSRAYSDQPTQFDIDTFNEHINKLNVL